MKFIKFSIFSLFLIIAYLAHILSKIEPDHVHEIALTFIAIGGVLAGGVNLLGLSDNRSKDDIPREDDANI